MILVTPGTLSKGDRVTGYMFILAMAHHLPEPQFSHLHNGTTVPLMGPWRDGELISQDLPGKEKQLREKESRVGTQTVYPKDHSSPRPESFPKSLRPCETDGKTECYALASQWDALSDQWKAMEHSHTTGPDSYGTVGEGDGGKSPQWRGSTPVGSSDPAMTPGQGQ